MREEVQTKKKTGHPSMRRVVVDEVGKHDLPSARTYLPGWRQSHPAPQQRGTSANEKSRCSGGFAESASHRMKRNGDAVEYKKIRCLSSWQNGNDCQPLARISEKKYKKLFSRMYRMSVKFTERILLRIVWSMWSQFFINRNVNNVYINTIKGDFLEIKLQTHML